MKYIASVLLIGIILFPCCKNPDTLIDKGKLLGNDYRLFQNTPVWELAKAVRANDVDKIKSLVNKKDFDLNYQESIFGQTLLMLTVLNHQFESCKTLLELGADVNMHDKYNGSSAMIEAAAVTDDKLDNTRFLDLVLKHGGNPNDEEVGPRQEGNTTRRTPLLAACTFVASSESFVSPLSKIKNLIAAGANVNYKNEFKSFPLQQALLLDLYDVVLYLLQHGAKYDDVIIDRSLYSQDGKKIFIMDYLREKTFPLNSEQYVEKMKIISFLKDKGLDYRQTPIPTYVVEDVKKKYPNTWKDYLDKY